MNEKLRQFLPLVALSLLLTVGLVSLAVNAHACPRNEVDTTYYSDASHAVEIGGSILACNCGGLHRWGRTSGYYTQDSYPCD